MGTVPNLSEQKDLTEKRNRKWFFGIFGLVMLVILGVSAHLIGEINKLKALSARHDRLSERLQKCVAAIGKLEEQIVRERRVVSDKVRLEVTPATDTARIFELYKWSVDQLDQLKQIGALNLSASEATINAEVLMVEGIAESDTEKLDEAEKTIEEIEKTIREVRGHLSNYRGEV